MIVWIAEIDDDLINRAWFKNSQIPPIFVLDLHTFDLCDESSAMF